MKIDPNAPAFPYSFVHEDGTVVAYDGMPLRFHAALELMKARMSDHAYSWSEHQGVAESALHAADQIIAAYNRSEQ